MSGELTFACCCDAGEPEVVYFIPCEEFKGNRQIRVAIMDLNSLYLAFCSEAAKADCAGTGVVCGSDPPSESDLEAFKDALSNGRNGRPLTFLVRGSNLGSECESYCATTILGPEPDASQICNRTIGGGNDCPACGASGGISPIFRKIETGEVNCSGGLCPVVSNPSSQCPNGGAIRLLLDEDDASNPFLVGECCDQRCPCPAFGVGADECFGECDYPFEDDEDDGCPPGEVIVGYPVACGIPRSSGREVDGCDPLEGCPCWAPTAGAEAIGANITTANVDLDTSSTGYQVIFNGQFVTEVPAYEYNLRIITSGGLESGPQIDTFQCGSQFRSDLPGGVPCPSRTTIASKVRTDATLVRQEASTENGLRHDSSNGVGCFPLLGGLDPDSSINPNGCRSSAAACVSKECVGSSLNTAGEPVGGFRIEVGFGSYCQGSSRPLPQDPDCSLCIPAFTINRPGSPVTNSFVFEAYYGQTVTAVSETSVDPPVLRSASDDTCSSGSCLGLQGPHFGNAFFVKYVPGGPSCQGFDPSDSSSNCRFGDVDEQAFICCGGGSGPPVSTANNGNIGVREIIEVSLTGPPLTQLCKDTTTPICR